MISLLKWPSCGAFLIFRQHHGRESKDFHGKFHGKFPSRFSSSGLAKIFDTLSWATERWPLHSCEDHLYWDLAHMFGG
jgi:hypothetical protein